MEAISDYLTRDHAHCDDLFLEAERAVTKGDWAQARHHFDTFVRATLVHFQREEAMLFPAFEQRTGLQAGPTMAMRYEHDQIRDVLNALEGAVDDRDAHAFMNQAEGLVLMLRQHNMKEEQILYPMADQALVSDSMRLVQSMKVLGSA